MANREIAPQALMFVLQKYHLSRETRLQADSMVLVGLWGAVAAFLTAIRVAALPAADMSAAERTAFPSITLPVQPARRTAHFCTTT